MECCMGLIISGVLFQIDLTRRIFSLYFIQRDGKIFIDPLSEESAIIHPPESRPVLLHADIGVQCVRHGPGPVVPSCEVEEPLSFHSQFEPSLHLNGAEGIRLSLAAECAGWIGLYSIVGTRRRLRRISTGSGVIRSIQIHPAGRIGRPVAAVPCCLGSCKSPKLSKYHLNAYISEITIS